MALEKIYLEDGELGKTLLQSHVRTNFSRDGKRTPETDVFQVISEKMGGIDVIIPHKRSVAGRKYNTPVELVDVYVIPLYSSKKYESGKRAIVAFECYCSEIRTKEGV